MILQALVRLAEAEGLVGDPGYFQQNVRWVVDITDDGSIVAIHGPELDDKRKQIPRRLYIPRLDKTLKSISERAEGLVQKMEFLFGITSGSTAKDIKAATNKHQSMLQLVRGHRALAPEDAGICAMERCLVRYGKQPDELGRIFRESRSSSVVLPAYSPCCAEPISVPEDFLGMSESWLMAFRLNGALVCRSPAIIKAVAQRTVSATSDQTTGLCTVTGRHVGLTSGHPIFTLGKERVSLINFNVAQGAFQHLNRESLENAPIGSDTAIKIGEALCRLVAKGGHATPDGRTLPPRNWQITSDTCALYWCESAPDEPDPLSDPWFASLPDAATPEQVEQCFRRPYRDGVPLELDPRPFHLLILSSAKARVVLRRAETKSLHEVVRSVRQWADDVRITPRSEKDKVGLRHLASATVSQKSKDRNPDPPADLATRLYACALDDRLPLPPEMTATLLRRIRSHDGGGESQDLTISTARVALLKAAFNRDLRLRPAYSPIGKEFAVSLDLDHPHPSYHLGRLFAVLERIQGEAIDDINASICDRFLGQALAAPALVFPRLMKLSHHHLGKIAGDNAGRRVNLDKLVDEIVGRINGRFPPTQPLADQGIFIIGYHHQRAAFFAKKAVVAPALTTTDNA